MLAVAAAILAVSLPTVARAQFHAPKTVEELEDEPQKPKNKKPDDVDENEGLPTDTGPDDTDEPPPKPLPGEDTSLPDPAQPQPQPEQASKPSKKAAREAPDAGAPDAGRAAVAAGAADGGLITEVAPIELPKSSLSTLQDAWDARRKAVLDHNPKAEAAAEKLLVAQREELGIRDLGSFAGALDREAEKRLEAKDPGEASRLADLAALLAPDLPAPRFAQAHVRFAADASSVGAVASALQDGLSRAFGGPAPRRALLGNLGIAAGLGLALAALLGLLALSLRPLRYALHDFHHLFPRGALPAQTAVLFVLVLVLPWAFRLGPMAELSALAAASFLYLRASERAVATLLLGILAALPLAAGVGARELVYTGTLSEALALVQQGGPDASGAVARLEALEKAGTADAPTLIALGLDAKRAGRYPLAVERFKRSLALNPRSSEAENDLGNALLLSGDLDGAREAYLKASELAPDSAVVSYNLAKLLTRRSQLYTGVRDVSADIESGKAATAAVYRLDRTLMDRPSDNRANLYVLDLEVKDPAGEQADPSLASAVASQLQAHLWGSGAPRLSMAFAGGLVALFWLLSLATRRLRPCTECSKCGRPVCGRCDREVAGGALCGQCHNAFVKRNAVDPRTRLAKEASAKKYQERWQAARRVSSYLLAGAGHLLSGRPVLGALFLLPALVFLCALVLGDGIFRLPLGGSLAVARQVLSGLLLVAVWAVSIRSYRAGEEGRR